MIQKKMLTIALALTVTLGAAAQEHDVEPQRWSLKAGAGGITLNDNSPDGQSFYMNEDQGNNFFAGGEYYLNKRFALTGALYFEQDGMLTDCASGIGLKKVNRMGVQAGGSYYFFPLKWIVQPHIGASLQTNFLNIGRMQGSGTYEATQGYPGSHLHLDWDVQLPALSVMPQLGVDIRFVSTVSFFIEWNARFGLWGHNRCNVRFIDGPRMGQTSLKTNDNFSHCINIGLKMDFPTHAITSKTWNTLLDILYSVISSKSGR